MANQPAPSVMQHRLLQNGYSHFNEKLFGGKLPNCMLNFSRKAKSFGWYCAEAWKNGERVVAEISINPDQLSRPLREVYSTLVHEMCHHWQECFGKPPRKAYHNKEWSDRMVEVGLIPEACDGSGRLVGQKMTHSIKSGGPFELAFKELAAMGLIAYTSSVNLDDPKEREKKAAAVKVKYTCPGCEVNVWGKPELNLMCMDCDCTMEAG